MISLILLFRRQLPLAGLVLLALTACAQTPVVPVSVAEAPSAFRFIGEVQLPHRLRFQGTVVGGLSGIDYDRESGIWYLLSDDRSEYSPARFYTATLRYNDKVFDGVELTGVVLLRMPDGRLYPDRKSGDGNVPDPEGIRYDPVSRTVLWTSEGDRKWMIDPFIREVRRDGTHVAEAALPQIFRMSREETGPRDNLVFEGLTLSSDGTRFYTVTEAPLYQDGPVPELSETRSPVRIIEYDRKTMRSGAQYAYMLDKLPRALLPISVLAMNGIPEILAIDAHRFLVLERAYAPGLGITARLFEIDLCGATDVSGIPALAGQTYIPVKKRLLLDLGAAIAPVKLDNIEGMAWGPRLPNGKRSLVFVSDDNFSALQMMQFLLFEVGLE